MEKKILGFRNMQKKLGNVPWFEAWLAVIDINPEVFMSEGLNIPKLESISASDSDTRWEPEKKLTKISELTKKIFIQDICNS